MAQPPHTDHPHGGGHGGGASSEADATTAITSAGYTNPTNLVRHGHSWHASATDTSGNPVSVVVDGHGGVHLDDETDDDEQPEPTPPPTSSGGGTV